MIEFIKKLFNLAPPVTEEMRLSGITWLKVGNNWREVCSTCQGNCGQCGLTQRLGCEIGPSLAAIAKVWGKSQTR